MPSKTTYKRVGEFITGVTIKGRVFIEVSAATEEITVMRPGRTPVRLQLTAPLVVETLPTKPLKK